MSNPPKGCLLFSAVYSGYAHDGLRERMERELHLKMARAQPVCSPVGEPVVTVCPEFIQLSQYGRQHQQ